MSKVDIQFNLRVPSELKKRIEVSAKDNNRSINAEAVSRLYNSFSESQQNLSDSIKAFEEILRQNRPSSRRKEIAFRLNECLNRINEALTNNKQLHPARIAKDLGENYAEPMENFFMGIEEPSFLQLENLAKYLNVSSDWLLFGEGEPFSVQYTRIPKPVQEGINWLIDKELDNKCSSIYFLRKETKEGELMIIKQYNSWHCSTFTTPYHISEEIGATGERDLIHLFSIWELLYKQRHTPSIKSYLISAKDYTSITSGQVHPLSIIKKLNDHPWWEDIWDNKHYINVNYWIGWKKLCERINRGKQSQ